MEALTDPMQLLPATGHCLDPIPHSSTPYAGADKRCSQPSAPTVSPKLPAMQLHHTAPPLSFPPVELSNPGKGIEGFLQYAHIGGKKKKSKPDTVENKQAMPSLRMGKAFIPYFKNFLQSKFNESRDKTDAKAHFAL